MANYAQTVNVIGAIKTTKTAAAFETTGLVLKLYRAHFATVPVEVSGAPEPLDVAAGWNEKRTALIVGVVNPTATEQRLVLNLMGMAVPETALLRQISGTNERAYNEPGKPALVVIEETAAAPFGRTITLPPMSISLYELPVATPRKFLRDGRSGQRDAADNRDGCPTSAGPSPPWAAGSSPAPTARSWTPHRR